MTKSRLRFGIFMAPVPPRAREPVARARARLELVEWLDELGYDEAWIGEHHSAGYEIIGSPEVFIAGAAERTRHIRLGTGVSSLPYHHPFMLADRIRQLDLQTRGRVMFGVGPGALPTDAFMMGIDPATQRDRMLESLRVLDAAPARRDGHGEDRLVRAARGAPAAAAVQRGGRRDRGREPGLAGGRARGGRVRPVAALDRRDHDGRLQRARQHLVDLRGAREGVRPDACRAAAGGWSRRCTSPRRASRRARTCSFGLLDWARYFREISPLPLVARGRARSTRRSTS